MENLQRLPDLDDPWRRLPWVTLAAVSLWILLLAGFAFLLQRAEPPVEELKPLEARIVEVPPDVGGLAGGGGAPHPAAPAQVKPRVAPAPVAPRVHPKKKTEAPPMPVSPNGTATTSTTSAQPAAGPAEGASSGGGGSGGGIGSGSGSGSGSGGIGSDSIGAHATYAPVPEIPDDLREDVMQTEAVAHFKVGYDGQAEVTLTTKTGNPRLNRILLDTLQQWRFLPATKNGVAINSEFDLRIPITVQ
ncbi:MAG: energy transducer TonB [Candidatus Binataceae bacterium]